MLNEDVIQNRSGKKFAYEYLTHGFSDNQISVLRILDSHSEVFSIPKAFERIISGVTNIFTSPEIEMLFIIYNQEYDRFKNQKTDRRGKKMPAHEWCKKNYGMRKVKSPKFVYDFWSKQPEKLVEAIKMYSSKSNDSFEHTLASILKDK